jgi:hypothetical protein
MWLAAGKPWDAQACKRVGGDYGSAITITSAGLCALMKASAA